MTHELYEQIETIRRQRGARLLILGHHYQRSNVLTHADATGDSLELARAAGANTDAESIVFCGVRFMAETADILTRDNQAVYMPEQGAGCPMADMATAEGLCRAMEQLGGEAGGWVPVVYVNSSVELKAACGRHGGSACTSSNAAAVFQWARSAGKRILFLPDEHLGWNTAHDLGIPDEHIAVYNPSLPDGGVTDTMVRKAEVLVWKGFCLVHQAFTVNHIQQVRAHLPGARIIVHPEAPRDVVRLADAHGSTSQIIRYVHEAEDGSVIVIGTEQHLVERLAQQQAGRVTIKLLHPSVCANMAKTNPVNLLQLLKSLPDAPRVRVEPETARWARRGLERMLSL